MKTFYFSDNGSTLSLVETSPATRTNSITVKGGQQSYTLTGGRRAAYLVNPGVTGPQHGTYACKIDVTASFAGARMRVALERNGAFIGGGWSAYEDISKPGTYAFSISDAVSSDWSATDKLQLFVEVEATQRGGTVRWTTGVASSVAAPFAASPTPSPTPTPTPTPTPAPAPTGTILFDGRAKRMTALSRSTLDDLVQSPAIWDGVVMVNNDISLAADSRYGKVFKATVKIGDVLRAGAIQATSGAAQLSHRRATKLGGWTWFGYALRVDSWTNLASLKFAELLSFGYQTSSNSQLSHRVMNDGGKLAWAMQANAGYADGVQGRATGTTHYEEAVLPVTVGQWQEFVLGVKQATDKTGAVELHHRVPGGSWSPVWGKTGVDTELYGPITDSSGKLIENFAKDASNWPDTLDKLGLYFNLNGVVATETVYHTGFVVCSDLATAKAQFPA